LITAQTYPKRILRQEMVAQTAENIRSSVELMDQTDAAETLVRNLVQMITEAGGDGEVMS
jgi:hypothetical protein